jgi:beta-glucosidase
VAGIYPAAAKLRVLHLAVVLTVSACNFPLIPEQIADGQQSDADNSASGKPWMDRRLSPDRRADLVAARMSIDEKIRLEDGFLGTSIPPIYWTPRRSLGGSGFILGVPRLGIPDLQIADSGSGLTAAGAHDDLRSTALPSPLALAASWDRGLAAEYGSVIGKEAHASGFNFVLGGGLNLTREPRGGRTFEYYGEDPILAGKMIAPMLRAIQKQHVIADVKHFAVNDQETGRYGLNAIVDRRALRESDLLAFEIAIAESDVGTVMCAYNLVNGVHACENEYLLNEVLKKDWGFKGWVVSDWGATHGTVASALAGLDQEFFFRLFYGKPLEAAVERGDVPPKRLDDMVHRILRTMFAVGVVDDPPVVEPLDTISGAAVARRVAENSAVLLKNADKLLPLDARTLHSIAVIGSHADLGVLSGGGSSQIDPAQGSGIAAERPSDWTTDPVLLAAKKIWLPSSPLSEIRARAPRIAVRFDAGTDSEAAATLAKACDVAIVFAHQWRTEGLDVPNLSLSNGQDRLIESVAAANPRTIVVLETGGAVLMPWLDKVSSVVEIWYPGISGGDAIADVLFGIVDPSGKLPISFPASERDLPVPSLQGPRDNPNLLDLLVKPLFFGIDPNPPRFDVDYAEGMKVGYKWYDAENRKPLFPFGYGMSYTTFAYSDLKLSVGNGVRAIFSVKNTGARAGAEIAQAYLEFPAVAGEPPRRLVAWTKIMLLPGQAQSVTLQIEPKLLAVFDVAADGWQIVPGNYRLRVGASSRDLRLAASFSMPNSAPVAP